MKIPGLTTEYFVENFVGGLQVEIIKGMLRLLEPTTLEQALKLARFYEQTLVNQPRRGNYQGGTHKANIGQSYTAKNTAVGGTMMQNSQPSLLVQPKATEIVNAKPRPLTYS